jgi:hypothetical protein
VRELLSKARARVIRHLVLDKGALALAIGMGGLILLLLAGTQVLDWYWPVLLASISLGVGIYQLRKHVPSRYQLAQQIDHRMELADSLSTAVYFSEHPRPGLEAVCAAQYRVADGLAGTVVLESALPMARSRYLLPALGLLAVASGLFVVRYLVMGSLDLNGSLVEMAVDTFFASPAEVAALKAARADVRSRPFDPSQPLSPEEAQIPIPPDAEKGKELSTDSQQTQDATGDKSEDQGEKGDQQDPNEDSSAQDPNKQDKQGREGDDKGNNDSQGQDQRSTLDKLRDALNNLMNKVSSNEAKQQNAKSDSKQKGQKSDKSGKADDDSNQDSQADAQPNSDDPGGKGKPNSEQAKSKSDQSGEKGASGNGDNDGKKNLEEAKAEEAMGKVSELLTQRSATISGEMMVEVGTTKQTLKTAMTQQKAGHTDSGGEIHRDQVPLADQPFVERYFEEIRKPAGTSKTGAAAGDSKAKSK